MGTKNNPGEFDCYAKAAPDEPVFVLLGRDRHAATLVRVWVLLRSREGEVEDKIAEALKCADAIDDWQRFLGHNPVEHNGKFEPVLMAATLGLDEHPIGYEHACQCDECRTYE